MTKIVVCLSLCVSLLSAAAISSRITLYQTVTLNGVALKPGEYRLRVEGEKLSLQSGKTKAESSVRTEEAAEKFSATAVRYLNADGKMRISEIQLGGTTTKLRVQ